MTKEEFVRNNRGINDSEDLPSEYLCQVKANKADKILFKGVVKTSPNLVLRRL